MLKINYVLVNSKENDYTKTDYRDGLDDFCLLLFHEPVRFFSDGKETLTFSFAKNGFGLKSLVIIPPGTPFSFTANKDYCINAVRFTFTEDGEALKALPEVCLKNILYLDKALWQSYSGLFTALETAFFGKAPLYEEECSLIFSLLLLRLRRDSVYMDSESVKSGIQNEYCLFSEGRFTMIRGCGQSEWNIDEITAMFDRKKTVCYNLYDRYFGTSPMKDIRDGRIEKAKYLLSDKSLSMAEVALRCGFSNQQEFSKKFKSETGVSPKNYGSGSG